MTLNQQKELAEKFRVIADDKDAVWELAEVTKDENADCMETGNLCEKMRKCANGDEVRKLADQWKSRK